MAMFRIRATSFVAGFAAASAIALYQLHTGVWSSHQELGNKVIFPNFWSEEPDSITLQSDHQLQSHVCGDFRLRSWSPPTEFRVVDVD
jgi:hypothetical protein